MLLPPLIITTWTTKIFWHLRSRSFQWSKNWIANSIQSCLKQRRSQGINYPMNSKGNNNNSLQRKTISMNNPNLFNQYCHWLSNNNTKTSNRWQTFKHTTICPCTTPELLNCTNRASSSNSKHSCWLTSYNQIISKVERIWCRQRISSNSHNSYWWKNHHLVMAAFIWKRMKIILCRWPLDKVLTQSATSAGTPMPKDRTRVMRAEESHLDPKGRCVETKILLIHSPSKYLNFSSNNCFRSRCNINNNWLRQELHRINFFKLKL